MLWARFGDTLPLFFGVPTWARPFELALLVLAAWIAVGYLLRLPFRSWVRSEQEQILRGESLGSTPWRPFLLMGSVIGFFFVVAAAGYADASLLQRSTFELIVLFLAFIAAGVGLELFVRWLVPGPERVRRRLPFYDVGSNLRRWVQKMRIIIRTRYRD
jgi:hypothetical protein